MGGGHGPVSIGLAEEFPELLFIVQDLPDVVAGHPSITDTEDGSRVRFMEYDFFTEQPIKGADVYFFRAIFHNRPEAYCVQILRNQVPAMHEGTRLVIDEGLPPKPGTLSSYLERQQRYVSSLL